jgi:micrococcal nuclease
VSAPLTVTIRDVIDGDTVEIRFANGSTDRLRLLGVDTPEVHVDNDPAEFEGVPETAAGRTCLREAGHDASAFLEQYEGESVGIAFDEQADTRGSYGRLLVYLLVDGRNVNLELVERGHARVYDSTFSLSEAFYAAEETAQAERRQACRSDAGTATASGFDVVRVHADAAGNDNENLNDEYVIFEYTGETSLDISGWTISDEADHQFVVPDGTTLEASQRLRLSSGTGTDSADKLYWSANRAIWNNGGDTVFVRAANGTLVLEHAYG